MWKHLANESGLCGPQLLAPHRALQALPGVAILLVISALYSPDLAGGQNATEYQLKAAYLYNLAKSAEWPQATMPSPGTALVIGVLAGDDEFVDVVRTTTAGRVVKAHPITVKRVNTEEEIKSCQLLFVRSSAGSKRSLAAISASAGRGVLLVGEDEEFLREGGMVNLVLKNGTVQMEVDPTSLGRAKITISPELLALARIMPDSSDGIGPGPYDEGRRARFSPPPEYPEIAKRMSIQGVAQVVISIRPDGTVTDARVIGGHPLLADALLKAVRNWKYEPAARESRLIVKVNFVP